MLSELQIIAIAGRKATGMGSLSLDDSSEVDHEAMSYLTL